MKLAGWIIFASSLISACDRQQSGDDNGGVDAGIEPERSEYGLDERPPNQTCLAPERPASSSAVRLEQVFSNLDFRHLVWMGQPPGDDSKFFTLEQRGVIQYFENDEDVREAHVFANITDRVDQDGEMGLLGMAFHPDWPEEPFVFLSYTTYNGGRRSIVSRFRSDDGGETLDPKSEKILLSIDQPRAEHNAGSMAFGPDGYLYVSIGDGGRGGDPDGNAQNVDVLLGKVLRIDPVGLEPYAIPPDNPFANGGGRPEIYAWGFRNPWRFSFDRETGELWLGDVGQGGFEEINRVELGGNYGWNIKEGSECFDRSPCDEGVIDPVLAYPHEDENRAVTGGFVYRGEAIPSLVGTFVFGDFVSGRIFAIRHDPQTGEPSRETLAETGLPVSSLAEGNDGELYVLEWGGTIRRIVAAGEEKVDFPSRLSETGCVDPEDPSQPAEGLIPYGLNAPFWSDGAEKKRWLALPDGEQITVREDGDWEFPVGSVLVKQFALGERLVETRLLVRHDDGGWGGYSYAWNDDQSDAILLQAGKVASFDEGKWIYPSRTDCLNCHTQAAGGALGPETGQLNRDFVYTSTNREANQLNTLSHIEMLEDTSLSADEADAYPDPFGDAELDARARSYLHTNCSQCHRSDGKLRVSFDLRYHTPMGEREICEVEPVTGDLGVEGARRLVPGEPERSLIYLRMKRRDAHGMPPIGSHTPDADGADLIRQWIEEMSACR